jgi:hypothetical protein
MLHHIHFI